MMGNGQGTEILGLSWLFQSIWTLCQEAAVGEGAMNDNKDGSKRGVLYSKSIELSW